METEKPKRILSTEALEKLKYAREKALEAKRQNKLINKFEKDQKRELKQAKHEQTYNTILELKKQKEPVKIEPEPEPEPKPKQIPRPKPKPEPEIEYESSSEEELPPPQKSKRQPLPPPPPPLKPQKTRPRPRPKQSPEENLYSKANVEILKQKLYEQTKRRLMNDLFSY